MDENKTLPEHIAIIMDGNGRWAKKRLKPRSFGHTEGMNNMIKLADYAKSIGIKYMTVYALSTENLARPQKELDFLFDLFRGYFKSNVKKMYKRNSAVKVIGDLSALPEDVEKLLEDGGKLSPENPDFTLIMAVNYGSRAEILHAANIAVERGKKLTEADFKSLLYTDGIPDPDLIIRTGGEKRLSNFLAYQSAYAELYFTDVLFPDFNKKQLDKALADFSKRERRFGKL